MDTTDAFSLIPERHFLQRKRPSGLCQVQAQTFLVTCRKGLGTPAQGETTEKQAFSACMWGLATSFFPETWPSAFRKGEHGNARRGLTWTQAFPTDF